MTTFNIHSDRKILILLLFTWTALDIVLPALFMGGGAVTLRQACSTHL